jgi:hypothetical protein
VNKSAEGWKATEVQIWTCIAHDFIITRSDADHRLPAPECPTCGKPTVHSGPATAQEILHRVRLREIKA